jgi:hypothetical protein
MRGIIVEFNEEEVPTNEVPTNEVPTNEVPIENSSIDDYDLGQRDNYLSQIEQQIKNKRNFLLSKRDKLKHLSKENEFLVNVRNDYQNYHDIILKQKKDQIKSMELLNQYISDIMVSGKLTEQDIKNQKQERDMILREMDKIKKDLDGLIKKNDEVIVEKPSEQIQQQTY